MTGAAGAGRAALAARRSPLDAAPAAADAEARDELPDVGRPAFIADDLALFSRGNEALEPLAAILAGVFV
jgi:hypothetical protein